MNKDSFNLGTFRIVPTIRKNPFAQQNSYRYTDYAEEGRPTGLPEPEIDVTEAQALLAQFMLKR